MFLALYSKRLLLELELLRVVQAEIPRGKLNDNLALGRVKFSHV